MVQRHKLLMLAGAAAVVAGAVGAMPASAAPQKIRFANWVPPTHTQTPLQKRWYELVEKYSNGGLVFQYDKAAVAKPDGQYDVVKNGVRDIVWHIPGYTPGRQELVTVAEGPFKSPSATYTSPILQAWYHKHGFDAKEFNDVHLLFVWLSGGTHIHTTKGLKPVTLEGLKGVKVRGRGGSVASAKALGLSVVSFPMNDAYDALQRGTIDGLLSNFEAIVSFNMTELLPNHLIVPGSMASASFSMIMNKKTYDGLTASNRAAIDKASGVFGAAMFGKEWDQADVRAKAKFKKMGQTFNTLSDAQLKIWKDKLEFIRQAWIEKANKKGVDGKAAMEDFEKMLAAGPDAVMKTKM
jgi:TRAP-type C4-dicarboxylate transport system substrate-binding protein